MLSWLVFFVSFLNYTELEFPIYAWLSYTAEPHFQYNIKSVLKIQASWLLLERFSAGKAAKTRIWRLIVGSVAYLSRHDGRRTKFSTTLNIIRPLESLRIVSSD